MYRLQQNDVKLTGSDVDLMVDLAVLFCFFFKARTHNTECICFLVEVLETHHSKDLITPHMTCMYDRSQ